MKSEFTGFIKTQGRDFRPSQKPDRDKAAAAAAGNISENVSIMKKTLGNAFFLQPVFRENPEFDRKREANLPAVKVPG